jgi:hypothetical protein
MKTLGDYRDACVALAGEDCDAVRFLDKKIAAQGRDMTVIAPESQMWLLLATMMPPLKPQAPPLCPEE